MSETTKNKKEEIVIMQVVDNEGNPLPLKANNVKILAVAKKLEVSMVDLIQNNDNAFIIKL